MIVRNANTTTATIREKKRFCSLFEMTGMVQKSMKLDLVSISPKRASESDDFRTDLSS